MNSDRYRQIVEQYSKLRIAVVGDFCLDRYLEIDTEKSETSLETGLPVYNVARTRSQPGGAGNLLNNIAALGVAKVYPLSFCGQDGEGYELQNALRAIPQADMQFFVSTPHRKTFTYCKPLILEAGKAPRELNRFDTKNWTVTPPEVQEQLAASVREVAPHVDAFAILDQVDHYETGVVTSKVLEALWEVLRENPELIMLADSRQTLKSFPPFSFKMNRDELVRLVGCGKSPSLEEVKAKAIALARQNNRTVFITLSELGILGASSDGRAAHAPCLPLRGEIDIVGAGDSVTASLTTAAAAGATLEESLEIANGAASVVIHKLGTTGTASTQEIEDVLFS